jgi:GntR family transcriptional repressor for pyruvate dehydrogenase complex
MTRRGVRIGSNRRPKVKITDEILEDLRQDIVSGKLPRGHRMPSERQLADTYGVSQPTVREVMRSLETIGLVEVHHGSGAFVSSQGEFGFAAALLNLLQLNEIGLLEVQAVRRVLSIESTRMAAASATDDQIAEAEKALERLAAIHETTEAEAGFTLLLDFQQAISTAANSSLISALEMFLAQLMASIQTSLLDQRPISFWQRRVGQVQDERSSIVKAVKNHDPDQAEHAAKEYFEKVRRAFEADPLMRNARLSDPALIKFMSDMPRQFRDLN